MSSVTAIMQARMGSSRLPGKVLKKVHQKTFLEHAFERLQCSKSIDTAVIATTEESEDDVIAQFCQDKNWAFNRGSELDVLDRYYQTALKYPADIIVRVTSDCPLLDPAIIDAVVEPLKQSESSICYTSNTLPPRHYPRGLDVEAFTFQSLERAWQLASEPFQREHVTPFINSQPELFPQLRVSIKDNYSSHRWTLDTQEDNDLLFKLLESIPEPVSWLEILSLVEKNPTWPQINSSIKQKTK